MLKPCAQEMVIIEYQRTGGLSYSKVYDMLHIKLFIMVEMPYLSQYLERRNAEGRRKDKS